MRWPTSWGGAGKPSRLGSYNCLDLAGLVNGTILLNSALVVGKYTTRTRLDLQWQVMRVKVLISCVFRAFWLFGALPGPGEFPDYVRAGLVPFPYPVEGVAGAFDGRGCESAVYG